MGVEAIVRVVEAEAVAEAESIVDRARGRAHELVAAADATATEQVREACARAEPAARAEAMRRVNAARVRLLERQAASVADRVDAVARAAAARLIEITARPDDARWTAAVARLVDETAGMVGRDGRILVRSTDRDAAQPIAERAGCRVEVSESPAGHPVDDPLAIGVVGWSADGRIEVDATVRSRLMRARTDLAEPIAVLLGEGR